MKLSHTPLRMLFSQQIVCLLLSMISHSIGLQYVGRALSFDWHFRSQKYPPFRETLDLHSTDAGDNELHYKFVAYGKHWTVDVLKNNVLYTHRSEVTERNVDGRILKRVPVSKDCYYVGTVKGGDSEYGMASISVCGDKVNGLLVTNANDYVIYEKDWKQNREKRSINDVEIGLEIANTTEFDDHIRAYEKILEVVNSTVKERMKRSVDDDVRVPKFYKLDPPSGRNLFVELGVIVDKYFMDDFKKMISPSTSDMLHHILLSFNNAQLWYIHPTFGFNVWLVLRDIVLVNEELPLSLDINTLSNPSALCKWVKTSFKDNSTWDEVIILSSKPNIWHGRVGLAQRAGVCSVYGNDRCAGVNHVNFQMASLARLIAHEAMHPLGVADDYEGSNSAVCYSGIMRRGVWQDHDWSVCAVQTLEKWAGAMISDCIARHSTPSLDERTTPPRIPVNLAWRADAIQSSTYKSEREWGAWKATDGPITGVPENGDARYGSCTHTLREDNPWIRLDIGREYATKMVDTVVVFNRDDCCADRLKNFQVRIGNNQNFERNALCSHYKGGVSGGRNGAAVISCTRRLSGRYVSVQLMDDNSILTVCEIHVMARVPLGDFTYTQNECHDIDGFCPYWQEVGECTRQGQVSYMEEHCPYSCGVCRRPDNKPSNHNSLYDGVILPVTARPKKSCKDSHESCMHYAANGDCDVDIDTKRRCPLSCNVCSPSPTVAVKVKPTTVATTTTPTTTPTTTTSTTTVTTTTTQTSTTAATIAVTIAKTDLLEIFKAKTKPASRNEMLVTPSVLSFPTTTERPETVSAIVTQLIPSTTYQLPATSSPTTSAVSIAASDCMDEGRHCDSWVNMGYCASSSVIRELCPKSCDCCPVSVISCDGCNESTMETVSSTTTTRATRRATSSTTTSTTAPLAAVTSAQVTVNPFQSDSDCRDELQPICKKWSSAGLCGKQRVAESCRKSCGGCRPQRKEQTTSSVVQSAGNKQLVTASSETTQQSPRTTHNVSTTRSVVASRLCKDTNSACRMWANADYCGTESVARSCPLSCSLCSSDAVTAAIKESSQCVDSTSQKTCRTWSYRGYCNRGSVRRRCQKTCKAC